MCGVVGIVGLDESRDPRGRALRMNAQIVHRGPDDAGIWHEDGMAFAMRRLSIIDLAGGHQPMISPRGSVLVFNGEVYNYQALRERLEASWDFRTHSDTEVVLALLETEGIAALSQLEGMFAFALLDRPRQRLHLVRDRLGKKPMYYTDTTGPLFFASELKALLAGLDAKPALNRQALHDYLTLRYVPAPATPWQGIAKLEPGQRLELDLRTNDRSLHRWWELHVVSARDTTSDPQAEFEQLFLAAVEKRLLASDVPVGVLLSGGLDSSAVSAAAVELGHREFHTFSVGFTEGGDFSELGFAREVARHLGSHHHEVVVGQDDFVSAVPELVWQTDEPIADLATIPLHAVALLAREHVKVVLSGEGSDEVLAGYDFDRIAREDSLRRRALASLSRRHPPHMTWVFGDAEKAHLWRSGSDGLRPTAELVRGWYAEAPSSAVVDRMLEVYCRSWLPEDLLMKADKATMAASLELRTPFLDHALVEWAARLPLDWKVGNQQVGFRSKRILREFAGRRLPRTIVDRPKRGFPVPAYSWLATGLAPWAEARLLGNDSHMGELFRPEPIRETLRRATAGDLDAAHRSWALIVLDHWLERWT